MLLAVAILIASCLPAQALAGAWTQPRDRRPYDDHGRPGQSILWMEGEYGITDRLTVGVQAVWKDLRYEDDFTVSGSCGWGDTWIVGRYAVLGAQWRISLGRALSWPAAPVWSVSVARSFRVAH